MKKIILLIILHILFRFSALAQQPADTTPFIIKDTTFIFTPARPLIASEKTQILYKNVAGIDLLFSNSGVGVGLFYDRIFNQDYKLITEIYFSGIKNTDELEYIWDPIQYTYIVPNKIRRLSVIPLSIGIQRYIGIGNLSKSFRPYISLVATPTLIWEMPYKSDWFRDVKYSKAHYRMGGGIQIGADFGAINTSFISFKMRYIYTPFGEDGLESIIDSPIHNFGRFYISLSLGGLF
jgi:hypothetical protein